MKLSTTPLACICAAAGASAFSTSPSSASIPLDAKPIYDPLGLYPEISPERTSGLIQPLEKPVEVANQLVTDPLNLYADKSKVDSQADMSRSLPFLARPLHLDGSMAGDAGFDPLGFAAGTSDAESSSRLAFMRGAELKHARIAMLAALGWPVAELFHNKLAFALSLKPFLMFGDRVPSVLNGGLGHAIEPYWPFMAAALALASGVEIIHKYDKTANPALYEERGPGDLAFDPLNLSGGKFDRRTLELAEIKNGRVAMLAVTAFAFQEAFTGAGVIPQLTAWLHPHSAEFLAEQGLSSNLEAVLAGAF